MDVVEAGLPDGFMVELSNEATSLGYVNGADYAVWGVPADLSSELVELGKRGDTYLVWYRDMGRRYDVIASSVRSDVRREFLLELGRVAGPRGRGPYVDEPAPRRGAGMTREQLIAQILNRPRDV